MAKGTFHTPLGVPVLVLMQYLKAGVHKTPPVTHCMPRACGAADQGQLLCIQLYITPDRPMSTSQGNVIHTIVKNNSGLQMFTYSIIYKPSPVSTSVSFCFSLSVKIPLECRRWILQMSISGILLPAGPMKSEDREICTYILFWRVLWAGIASVGNLLVLGSHFALMNAMHYFFSSSIWNQEHPFICYHCLGQSLQPHLFPQEDDAFTGRPTILMLFDGSGRRERWYILLKDHFKSEGRRELPAGTICLIAMGKRTRDCQGKSKCFVFVTGKVPAMGLP